MAGQQRGQKRWRAGGKLQGRGRPSHVHRYYLAGAGRPVCDAGGFWWVLGMDRCSRPRKQIDISEAQGLLAEGISPRFSLNLRSSGLMRGDY